MTNGTTISIIIKWIKPQNEQALEIAETYFIKNAQGNIKVHVPSLLMYEVHNTIARLSKKTPDKLLTFLKNLELEEHTLHDSSIVYAYDLCRTQSVTFYDACYIALAHELDCDFITADTKLVKKVNLPFVKALT